MAQAWILRADRPPMAAVRDGSDDAICGTCALRGDGAFGRACYVSPWLGPNNVWKALPVYLEPTWADLPALVAGRSVRLGAYGDPAADREGFRDARHAAAELAAGLSSHVAPQACEWRISRGSGSGVAGCNGERIDAQSVAVCALVGDTVCFLCEKPLRLVLSEEAK